MVLSSFIRQTASTSQIYSNFLKPLGSIDRALFVLSLVHSKPRWLGHRADGSTGRMSWRQVSTGCDERNTPGQAKAQIQYIGKMGSWDKMMACQNYSCGRNLPSSKMFLIYLFNVYNSDYVLVILSAFVLPHIAIASIASQHPNTLPTILILKKPTSNIIKPHLN